MKTLLVLFALNAASHCGVVPLNGGFSGGFVKQGGIVAGPAAYSEGYVDGAADAGVGAGGGASFSASFGGGLGGAKTVAVEKHLVPLPPPQVISEKVHEVETEAPLPPPPAKKTVIERTVIPNYVEKTIRVPSYVEKTIRVPTYVEKTIKVPAAPTIVEKTISQEDVPAPAVHKVVATKVKVDAAVPIVPVPDYGSVRVYHKYKTRPHRVYEKEIITNGGGGYGEAGYIGGGDYVGGGYGGGGAYGGGLGGAGFSARANFGGGGLFDQIFNIPIQTLGAVRGLLNGIGGSIGGGISGGGGFSKSYSAY